MNTRYSIDKPLPKRYKTIIAHLEKVDEEGSTIIAKLIDVSQSGCRGILKRMVRDGYLIERKVQVQRAWANWYKEPSTTFRLMYRLKSKEDEDPMWGVFQ